ncbi:MAG: protein arginine kinase [Peptococcaceae bacterium]|nr:protein arginine kinase [Peptococcaceae bacterium]
METLHDVIVRTPAAWANGRGDDEDVVVSSRVRLARNYAAQRFPAKQDREEALQVWKHAADFAENHAGYRFYRLDEADPLDRQALLAKHLISAEHAVGNGKLPALVLSDDQDQSIMINEEDHLRLQVFRRGFAIGDAWQAATLLDDKLGSYGAYAFNKTLGYLTSCPTNLGTGMRASVMLHLPALTAGRQMGIFQEVQKMGLTVRGFLGEGSKATGDLYQLSNQVTLGRSEEDILATLRVATHQIVEHERQLREQFRKQGDAFADQCYRALGTLAYARQLSGQEAYQLLSLVRLGTALDVLDGWQLDQVDRLFIKAHPGYVQFAAGADLDDKARDKARATMIRKDIQPS